jgi:MarR-like DNA-binding transcriptional regulator SgrR of sgrS sRNA
VLRWASTTEAVTFDPNAAYLAPTIAENHQVYEGLTDLNARYELEPSLATVWRLLDPLTWEFELRRDVTFHDGEPFTPEDVVFSLGRAASGVSQFKGFVQPIASVEVVGDHTVRIRTAEPNGGFSAAQVRSAARIRLAERDGRLPSGDRRNEEPPDALRIGNRDQGIIHHRLAGEEPDEGVGVEQDAGLQQARVESSL